MENNKLNSVAIGSGHHKKARFNLSHDVNSTYQFGEVQPVLFRDMIAGEKDVVDIESMVRLAPMVAPTFGRIKHKEWHHFIPMTDLFPHYGNFLAQNSYRGVTATKLPNMTLGALSYFCLVGSKMSIYADVNGNTGTEKDSAEFTLIKNPSVTSSSQAAVNLLSRFTTKQGDMGLMPGSNPFNFKSNDGSSAWDFADANTIELKYLMNAQIFSQVDPSADNSYLRTHLVIPVSNFDTYSWFDYDDKSVAGTQYNYVTDLDPVSLDSADAVLPYDIKDSSNNHYDTLLAFRFSNFGKRLYKILVGLGYQLDFSSTQRVSLLPLFAFFKAWFDNFGLTRYKSWQDTKAYKLLMDFDYAPMNDNFDGIFDGNLGNYYSYNDFVGFIRELGNCWFTDETDFVTAHTCDYPIDPNANNNMSTNGMFTNVPDLATSGKTNVSQLTSVGPVTGGNMNTPVVTPASGYLRVLSAMTIKQLMDMYRWTNRTSIAGKATADLLKAQGYGYFLYSCKSNFIGYTEQDVQIYDVVSSSDTYNSSSNDGALLGQYAGRGLGYDKSKTMTFEATEDGFWIGLCCVVPKSGYSQGLNPSLIALDKWSRYNPDLDGKYMTLSPKSVVHGSMPFSTYKNFDALRAAYGFIPIYSGLKIAQNVSNGGFSLRSQREIFRPYMLDKVLDFGERKVDFISSDNTKSEYQVSKIFSQFPVAGEFWKYVGRYPWMGNFDRIFAHAERNTDVLNQITLLGSNMVDESYEYCVTSDDNFMIHHVVNQQAYAPMLPIELSFDTQDDDGNFDTSIDKA